MKEMMYRPYFRPYFQKLKDTDTVLLGIKYVCLFQEITKGVKMSGNKKEGLNRKRNHGVLFIINR